MYLKYICAPEAYQAHKEASITINIMHMSLCKLDGLLVHQDIISAKLLVFITLYLLSGIL